MMDTQTKTPVEIVQELIAIHATRKEAAEKLMPAAGEGQHTGSAAQQSDQFITALMNELSDFGDGVQSVAGRENDYQITYKNMLGSIDTLTPEEQEQAFQGLEESLKKVYKSILENKNELPESLQKIITEQNEKL